MNLYGIFPKPVAKFSLGRDFTTEEIAFVDSQPTHTNVGNTTSDDRYVLRHDTMKSLMEFTDSCVAHYLKSVFTPKHEVKLRVTQSWLNYSKEGQYHHKHAHPNSFVSGVLYMKALKNKDKIHFYQEEYHQIKLPTDSWNLYNSESWWFEVNTGDLILFPSNLTHSVEPVVGEERVSLAFNTFPVGYVGDENNLTALHV